MAEVYYKDKKRNVASGKLLYLKWKFYVDTLNVKESKYENN